MGALISGNFDDSQAPGDLWTVGGYVGYANQWDYFERLWEEALKRHEVPYFHKREMADPSGPFSKWIPPQEHVEEVAAFFKDLVAAITKSGLYMVASTVWLSDLERFNRETGVNLEPYPLAAHACLGIIGEKIDDPSCPITAVFDRVEKVDSKLRTARSYLAGKRSCIPAFAIISTQPGCPRPPHRGRSQHCKLRT